MTIANFAQTVGRQITYWFNEQWPNQELGPYETVEAYFRGMIPPSEMYRILRTLGYDEERARRILEISKRVFSVEQAIYLWRRGVISEARLYDILKANHVDPKDLEAWVKLTEYFPGPADIIRFAVREVFTPEVVREYRMMEDLPPEYLRLAQQVGIPEDVARWYWAAHWELPSLTMGFEMFRRKIITADQLKTLMRTLDIMPGWRDKLLQLAYEIPTRVDVRRMYELGVIDREKVREYYEKLGYTPEDAELLTRWTEVEYAREDRTLTVKQIIELYELGEISREEALQWLNRMGYPMEVAEYKITLAEHESAIKEAKEALNLLIEQYKAGVISYEQLIDEAYRLPLSPTTVQRAITRAYREKQVKVRQPSVATLKKWLFLGIITPDEFRDRLTKMGYTEQDAENFLREISLIRQVSEAVQGE